MSEFSNDLAALLAKYDIKRPKFAYGAGAFDGKVFYGGPYFDEKETLAATECFLQGKWSVNGEKVHGFEIKFSDYINQGHSVMVNSGSSADLLMIAAAKKRFGWKDGDGIIVSPVGFPTTVSAIVLNGLKPIFVDIEWNTLNFDLDKIDTLLNNDCMPKAILVSPVLGNPPDIDNLTEIAKQLGIVLLLDGCDSLGTTWRMKQLPEYFTASSCSFYPAHHITTLQGGMISSNDEKLIDIARSMSAWGRDCWCVGAANYLLPNGTCGKRFSQWLPSCECDLDHRYVYSNTGYNLQPLDLQGAIGIEQMKKIDEIHAKRRLHYDAIKWMFYNIAGIEGVSVNQHAEVSWFGVPVICNTPELKRALVKHLESRQIQTRNYFAGNLLCHEAYKSLGDYRDFPNANEVLKRVFWVGCAPFYTQEHLGHIEKAIKEFKT